MDEIEVKVTEFDDMSEQQKKFCELYVVNGNATKSAQLSGYSERTASAQGSRMLKSPKIIKYLNYLKQEQSKVADIDAEQAVKWVSALANPATGASHSTQLKALELLMKYFGLLIDKKEIISDTNLNVNNNASALSDDELDKLLKEYEKDKGSIVIDAEYTEM